MSGQLVLSYPFRFDMRNGKFATTNTATDTYKAQQITAFLRTEKGERALFPDFGIDDPVFNTFDSAAFLDSFLGFYGKTDIEITEIEITEDSGSTQDVAVRFK